jgi:hypothetical protein
MTVFGWIDANVGTREELAETAAAADGASYYLVARLADTDLSRYPFAMRQQMLKTLCEECSEVCIYHPDHFVPYTTIVCTHCCPTGTETYIPEEAVKLVERNLVGVFRADPLRSYR